MYDLSWLNPTPHAIAVYASQLLCQWSRNTRYQADATPYLGRTFTLPGPDFHRLDCTSFRLAVAVGTLIAERPPHGSVLAAFPHTAPTSGPNGNACRMRASTCNTRAWR